MAFLPQPFRVSNKGAQIFRDLVQRAQAGRLAYCAVVFGSSTASGVYHPGLSDYTIIVQDQAKTILGGLRLIKMAAGEASDAEALGGGKIHSVCFILHVCQGNGDTVSKGAIVVTIKSMKTGGNIVAEEDGLSKVTSSTREQSCI